MQNSSLLKILKTLSKDDLIKLKKFLKCGYFIRNKNCEKLLDILSQYHPAFTNTKLVPEKLFYRIFSREKDYQKNVANFRTLLSHLKKCINQFLIIEELNNNTAQKKLLLMDAYSSRGVDSNLITGITKKFYATEKGISAWYYLNHFFLYWKLYQEETKDYFNQKAKHFDNLNKQLDYFYAITKLKLGIEQMNLVKRKLDVQPLDLLPAIQSYIQQAESRLPSVLVLYAKFFDLMKRPLYDIQQFNTVFDLYKENINELAKEEAQEFIIVLYNLSNTKIKNNNATEVYKKLRFEVVQLGVERKLFITNGVIIGSIFTGIVISAATVAAFQWAFSFIRKYSKFLSTSSKEMILNATKGLLYFLRGRENKTALDYKKSIQFFETTKTRNIKYNRRKIWVLLQAHYEHFVLVGDLTIFKYIENFHTVVNRSKAFTGEEKRALLNTNNTIKFMVRVRNHPNLTLSIIKAKIVKFKNLKHFKEEWVAAQIDEFLTFKFQHTT